MDVGAMENEYKKEQVKGSVAYVGQSVFGDHAGNS